VQPTAHGLRLWLHAQRQRPRLLGPSGIALQLTSTTTSTRSVAQRHRGTPPAQFTNTPSESRARCGEIEKADDHRYLPWRELAVPIPEWNVVCSSIRHALGTPLRQSQRRTPRPNGVEPISVRVFPAAGDVKIVGNLPWACCLPTPWCNSGWKLPTATTARGELQQRPQRRDPSSMTIRMAGAPSATDVILGAYYYRP